MRVSNEVAVEMYRGLGYTVYRRVIEYYSGGVDEDAFGQSPTNTLTDTSYTEHCHNSEEILGL